MDPIRGSLRQHITASPQALGSARNELRGELTSWGITQQARDDILLVHSELVTNAIEAEPGEPIDVDVRLVAAGIELSVKSAGTSNDIPPRNEWVKLPSATQGRGLQIVQHLCHNLAIDDDRGHIVVSCRYRAQ